MRLHLAIPFHFGPLRLWPFANNKSTTIISQPNCRLSLSLGFDVRSIFTFHFHAVSSDTEAALFHPAELFCYAVWPAFGVAVPFFSRAWHTLGFAPPPKWVVAGPSMPRQLASYVHHDQLATVVREEEGVCLGS